MVTILSSLTPAYERLIFPIGTRSGAESELSDVSRSAFVLIQLANTRMRGLLYRPTPIEHCDVTIYIVISVHVQKQKQLK